MIGQEHPSDADDQEGRPNGREARPRSPTVAAVLSFIWPGLGQWYMGRRAWTVLYAVPPLLIIGALLSLASGGLEALAGRLFDPSIALAVLAGIVALALLRVAAMVHAWWLARRRERNLRRAAQGGRRVARLGVLASLVAIVLVVHAIPATWAWAFYEAGTAIFQAPGETSELPPETATPDTDPAPSGTPRTLAPGETAQPIPSDPVPGSPIPTIVPPAVDDGFTNVLFVGTDDLPSRRPGHRLTDSIILASFDRGAGTLQMISVPRNVSQFPQYWGGIHEGKLNTILSAAQDDPTLYPDGPMATLVGQVSYLLGVNIDYYASVDIPGFERLVDSVGGVDVVVREPITDPTIPFFMDVGPHHLDGATAVKFVRSRRGGGSNEDRSIRQQHVLLALRQKLSDPQMLPRLPEVLDAVAATVRTSLPPGRLGETLALARQASGASVSQLFLGPDEYATDLGTDQTDLENAIKLKLDRVAALSQDLWGAASYYSDPAYYQRVLAAAGS